MGQDLVYGKKFDNGLKPVAKAGGVPEQAFENEAVKEAWDKVVKELAKESEERKALTSGPTAEEEETVETDEALMAARKPPTSFPLHSSAYWLSVANHTVRTYVTLHPEPKTLQGVVSAVAQSKLKDLSGLSGQDCVLTFLDLDSLGESQGPGGQAHLRKKFLADSALIRKLVQGSMLGRGSQRRENDEATRVVDGDVVAIHDGFGHPGGQKDAKSMFKRTTAKKDSEVDSELKDIVVVFDDASIRHRKQRVKGSYTSTTNMTLASSSALTQCLPEKPYDFHPGHCTSNVFHTVKALAPTELWHTSRTGLHRVSYTSSIMS